MAITCSASTARNVRTNILQSIFSPATRRQDAPSVRSEARQRPTARRGGLSRPRDGNDAAATRRRRSPDRLPPHHREFGPQAWRVRAVSVSRGALPVADVEYVRLLQLAATTSERQVETTVRALLDDGQPFDYAGVQALVTPTIPRVPAIHIPAPDLAKYDALLVGGGRC